MKKHIFGIILIWVLLIHISVSAADITAGNGRITVNGAPSGSTLIIGLYQNSQLTETKLYPGSETITANPAIDFSNLDSDAILKAFLWNIDAIDPLCNSLAVTADLKPLTQEGHKMTITINGQNFTATLYDTEAAQAFKELLPITVTMNELNKNEKYFYFDHSLPTDSTQPRIIHEGDLMLYGSTCLVLFYETFASVYQYTKIGFIDNTSGLQSALGSGNVTVHYA